jgi:tetratricopeptide (TPR) repeat protein
MTKPTTVYDEKAMVSARINCVATGILKKYEIPVSDVIEAGIIYFLSLDDDDKVIHLLRNNFEVTDGSNFKIPHTTWLECAKEALALNSVSEVKEEIKNFKAAAKWLPDQFTTQINQVSLRKLSASEVVKKGNDLLRTGHLQEALTYYDYALMLYRKLKDHRKIGAISLIIGDAYRDIGNFSLALAAYEGAESYFKTGNNMLDQANLYYSQGVCFQLWGKYKEAITYLEKAETLFTNLGNWNGRHKTISRMTANLDFIEPDLAIKACDKVIEIFKQKKMQIEQKFSGV